MQMLRFLIKFPYWTNYRNLKHKLRKIFREKDVVVLARKERSMKKGEGVAKGSDETKKDCFDLKPSLSAVKCKAFRLRRWENNIYLKIIFYPILILSILRKLQTELLNEEKELLLKRNKDLQNRLKELRNLVKSSTELYIKAIQRGDVVWKFQPTSHHSMV